MLRILILSALIALSVAACGNKGPLVLPDQAAQKDKDKDKDKSTTPAKPATDGDSANKH